MLSAIWSTLSSIALRFVQNKAKQDEESKAVLKGSDFWEGDSQEGEANREVWRYKKDKLLQLVILEEPTTEFHRESNEFWIPSRPGKNYKKIVALQESGVTIKQFRFVGIDDFRIFTPEPTRIIESSGSSELTFFRYSILQMELAKILGYYDNYKSVWDFMERNQIQLQQD